MNGRVQRILIPFFYCLAVACLVEIPLAQTDMFGEDVILWDTLFRTILAMPGLWYFYREDQQLRVEVKWDFTVMAKLAAVGAIASIVFRILFEFIGMPGYESVEQNLLSGNPMLQIIVLLAASPMLEEFFFRGVLYGRLKEVVSVNHAIWISALGFGLYHANLSQGIYGFLMGLFLAWTMEKFQTVKAPIAVHIASNLAAMCMEWI
ncbi:MAG: CPBP family intramembrane metalloprotease [Lachnospiraceae bacterium]|nr:CPBP family intramembrane metalloprotease [Lachnospiraceae bacterium]